MPIAARRARTSGIGGAIGVSVSGAFPRSAARTHCYRQDEEAVFQNKYREKVMHARIGLKESGKRKEENSCKFGLNSYLLQEKGIETADGFLRFLLSSHTSSAGAAASAAGAGAGSSKRVAFYV